MITLNLKAENKQEEIIKTYLQENASEELANKINNGVETIKGNIKVISKKTLKGFIRYATEEARKQAEKGASSTFIEDSVVFGWAIHYFEENDIMGDLYNLDGTKYETPKLKTTNTPLISPTVKLPEPKPQISMFDFLKDKPKNDEPLTNKETLQNIEVHTTNCASNNKISPTYLQFKKLKEQYPDRIIIFKLGDFYEIFDNDATILADKLDLTLTARDFGEPNRTPLIGFPYHVAEKYFRKIADLGYKVVIKENNDEKINEMPLNIDKETGEVLSDNKNNKKIEILRNVLGDIFEVNLC